MGESERVRYLKRAETATVSTDEEVMGRVRDILQTVRDDGDRALHEYTERFDDVRRDEIRVGRQEIEAAADALSAEDREAIGRTIEHVRAFHEEQRRHVSGFEREFHDGVRLGQRIVPIDTVGTYIPGGRHPLIAAPAMTIVPARVAGVDRVVACAPPQPDGTVQPEQLYAMDRAGADEIYCVGGAQAIAAMAFGTESVPAVDKITGPGNVYVVEAKRQVFGRVGIDFLAGPSEVLILADDTTDPDLIAIDLLAQAEHDPDARAILVSTDEAVARSAMERLDARAGELRTESTARESWESNGEVVLAEDMDAAIEVANDYAIEHLQVMTAAPRDRIDDLRNYGSLFLGPYSPVVFGDKAVGTNHSLPTLKVARYTGGIWVGTYLKALTHQEATRQGADPIARHAARICELEGTHAHQLSAEARIIGDE